MRKQFKKQLAKKAILEFCPNGLIDGVDQIAPFQTICMFLDDNPKSLSWRGKDSPTIYDIEGLKKLAEKFINSFSRSDFPVAPKTVPDELVSIVMENTEQELLVFLMEINMLENLKTTNIMDKAHIPLQKEINLLENIRMV